MLKSLATIAITAAVVLGTGSAQVHADGMARSRGGGANSFASGGGCDNRFSGFYGGLHGSYASLESRLADRDGGITGTLTEISHEESSIGFGGSVGFNVQSCAMVWGIAADLSFADLGSNEDYLTNTVNITRSTDWYGSVRTRFGLAVGGMMLYATGGIGWADFATTTTVGGVGGVTTRLFDDTRVGLVSGVGTEYAWSDRVSIVSEALHYGFGSERTSLTDILGVTSRVDEHHSMWVTRIGINIKLGDHASGHPSSLK
jgi:outer membrane immunogenic protein